MTFATLVTLQVARAGTPPIPFPESWLTLRPSVRHPDGQRALTRHRLLWRPLADGLRVSLPLQADGTPFIAFDNLNLWFELHRERADIAYSVDLNALEARRPAIFRGTPGTSTLTLDSQPADLSAIPTANPPLAWVELRGLASSDAANPRTYRLDLPLRQVRWVYYVVTDRLDRVPSISDSDSGRAFDFELTTFPVAAPPNLSDRVAEALVAAHPQAKVHRLHSKRSPPTDGQPLKGLRLRMADQTCINDLPAPPSDQWMPWPVLNNPPQTALYSVIHL
ncbi:MAG: hypothetical protein VKO26_01060 [Cyanobacteriota bacterium]|nr:hypothetical protein [Cyanobacteriota bacterium]